MDILDEGICRSSNILGDLAFPISLRVAHGPECLSGCSSHKLYAYLCEDVWRI